MQEKTGKCRKRQEKTGKFATQLSWSTPGSTNMGRENKRRGAIFEPTQKLFSVVENVCGLKIKLSAGGWLSLPPSLSSHTPSDIVSVLDDTTDKTHWLVRKVDLIGKVHKKYLKPLDKTSIGVHFMNSKHQDHFSAQHQIESVTFTPHPSSSFTKLFLFSPETWSHAILLPSHGVESY
jgi:hypothetical protein